MQKEQETQVQSSQEYLLEEEMKPAPVLLPDPMDRGAWGGCSPPGLRQSDTTEQLSSQAVSLQ